MNIIQPHPLNLGEMKMTPAGNEKFDLNRVEALRLATNLNETPEKVVVRAEAYLAFLTKQS